MQLTKKFEIRSIKAISEFLNSQPVGRIASLDKNGYPQVIPMNFVYTQGFVYMHSHPFGEKLDNIRNNPKVGFEVDEHVCFLPSYYFHPSDASQADTLYISIVIKGKAEIVRDTAEKSKALNALMEKYQKEGKYQPLTFDMRSVDEVAVIKVVPLELHGKYKIGQHWPLPYRLKIASKIIAREGHNEARKILKTMGLQISKEGDPEFVFEPVM